MGVGGPGLWCAQEAERRKQARRRWKPYIYVNGVSVYLERQGDKNDRSFMTSHIVHAPPELCKDEVAPPSPRPHPPPSPSASSHCCCLVHAQKRPVTASQTHGSDDPSFCRPASFVGYSARVSRRTCAAARHWLVGCLSGAVRRGAEMGAARGTQAISKGLGEDVVDDADVAARAAEQDDDSGVVAAQEGGNGGAHILERPDDYTTVVHTHHPATQRRLSRQSSSTGCNRAPLPVGIMVPCAAARFCPGSVGLLLYALLCWSSASGWGGGRVRCDSPDYPQLREIWLAPVWLRPFIARRELVLRRSWRQEDDGTFVVRGPLCAPAHRQLYAPRV